MAQTWYLPSSLALTSAHRTLVPPFLSGEKGGCAGYGAIEQRGGENTKTARYLTDRTGGGGACVYVSVCVGGDGVT